MNTIWMQRTAEPTQGRIRLHLDLLPVEVEVEVDRVLGFGARRADDPFVVLADPEGNEFCVLRGEPRRS